MSISSFNEDIYTQILLRLPVKSVLNFKTVSKQWLSIASSPRFRQNHASRQHKAPATWLVFNKDSYRLVFNKDSYRNGFLRFLPPGQIEPRLLCPDIPVDLKVRDPNATLTCISSCNGLLLMISSKFVASLDDIIYTYYVYNPATSEFRVLSIPIRIRKETIVYASLAFDPSQSPHYKVVFLYQRYDTSTNSSHIEVYSSTTGICKDIILKEPIKFFDFGYIDKGNIYYYIKGIYSNGRIHWLLSMDSIFHFDVHTECINELPTPWFLKSKVYYFGESSGHLQFVQSKYDYSQTDKANLLDVYELNKDYLGWFLKYQVDLSSIASELYVRDGDEGYFGNIHEYCYVLSILQNEEGDETEESIMVILVYQNLVEYNLKTKTTKWLCRNVVPMPYDHPYDRPYKIDNYQFIPTLACVKTTSEDISRLSPGFQNLTRLELSGYDCADLCAAINNILESMDNLELLVVKGWNCGMPHQSCWTEPLNVPTSILSRVTTICFTSIYGDCCDQLLELLRYFLKNAKILQLLTIDFDYICEREEIQLLKKISMFPRGSPICQVSFT